MMDSTTGWDGQDPTLSMPHDDFQQFLDMGINSLGDNLQFGFSEFNQQGQNGHGLDGQDTTMQESMPSMTTAANHPAMTGTSISGHPSNDSLLELDQQIQYLQHQRHQQQQRQLQEQQRNFYAQSRMIPPTPNSLEMHPIQAQFYPQSDPQQQAYYDRGLRVRKDQDMTFTPLVSPAVTPLEPHFNIPEYTVPGAYFSPLSSPALHAQNEHSIMYDPRHTGRTNSPIDMTLESHSAPPSGPMNVGRKPPKKAAPKSRSSTRGIRQSPIVKPKRGGRRESTTISTHALGDILEPPTTQAPQSKEIKSSFSTASTEGSEDSISPEHLSDMAPPPIPPPGSANRSPYIQAQNNARTERLSLGSPATPASLMRMIGQSPNGSQPVESGSMEVDEGGIENFALPEPANTNKRPSIARIDTQSDGQTTPTMSSVGAKTPGGFQPLPSPSFPQPMMSASASQSPQIDPMNNTNGSSNGTRRTPSIAPRGSKKRASTSILASPALLPRISPSIKPLLPGGGGNSIAEDTAQLLLTSKSNYQNILEGTHLPGVSYPMELSTNLTSKRTSHKIAEQGRRNRINTALQEIATLLPKGAGKDSGNEKSGSGNENGGKGSKGEGQSANSKASTVELAIEYIKKLQEDLQNAEKRAEKAEKELQTTKA